MAKHILLIDDDTDDIELFGEALAEADDSASFHFLEDGGELLQRSMQEQKILPDLIFLDINMSSTSGWDCLSYLRSGQAYQNIPVIMYSTSSHQKEIARALQQGATGFITKPSSYKQLVKTLHHLLIAPADKIKETLANL